MGSIHGKGRRFQSSNSTFCLLPKCASEKQEQHPKQKEIVLLMPQLSSQYLFSVLLPISPQEHFPLDLIELSSSKPFSQ